MSPRKKQTKILTLHSFFNKIPKENNQNLIEIPSQNLEKKNLKRKFPSPIKKVKTSPIKLVKDSKNRIPLQHHVSPLKNYINKENLESKLISPLKLTDPFDSDFDLNEIDNIYNENDASKAKDIKELINDKTENQPLKKIKQELDFGSDFEFDLDDDCFSEEKTNYEINNLLDLSNLCRCVVLNHFEKEIQSHGLHLLRVSEHPKTSKTAWLAVGGYWDLPYTSGVILSVQTTLETNPQKYKWTGINIGNYLWTAKGIPPTPGLVIFEPDRLVSSSLLAKAFFCMRSAFLKGSAEVGESDTKMFIGSLTHRVFQDLLVEHTKDIHKTKRTAKQVSIEILNESNTIIEMFTLGVERIQIEEKLLKIAPSIDRFIKKYLYPIEKKNNMIINNKDGWQGQITEIIDIEDSVWLPSLGLKGRIDAIVKTKKSRIQNNINNLCENEIRTLEFKSGRRARFHRAQVAIYDMMLKAEGIKLAPGLLAYLDGNDACQEIHVDSLEEAQIMRLRNEVAIYLDTNSTLPAPINDSYTCSRCSMLTTCSIMNKVEILNAPENEKRLKDSRKEQINTMTSYLSDNDISYLTKSLNEVELIEKKSLKSTSRNFSDLWLKSPQNRENEGEAAVDLKLIESYQFENGFHARFSSKNDLRKLNLNQNDFIMLSTNRRICYDLGFIEKIERSEITLKVERDPSNINKEDTYFYVDAYTFTSQSSSQTENLIELMQDSPLAAKLRKLLTTENDIRISNKKELMNLNLGPLWHQISTKLNSTQQEVIKAYLNKDENEFLLIHGMPGTGKTYTLASLIRVLVSLGQRVLITSLSNKAVDNVLLLLLNTEVKFLRLSSNKDIGIHPDLLNFTLNALMTKNSNDIHSPEILRKFLNQINVFGVTSKGSSSSYHDFLHQLDIDCVVFDEAGQLPFYDALPALLVRTNLTKVGGYIVVGDPKQLAPHTNVESLYERISTIQCLKTSLREQYRMNQVITYLANCLTYDGQMKCANKVVSNAVIVLPSNSNVLKDSVNRMEWLRQPLSTHIDDSILFIDTQYRNKNNDKYTNHHEMSLIVFLLRLWLKAGFPAKDVAVIATYRAQVSLFHKMKHYLHPDIDISTVDAFQGRDKSLIFYSCTRTEEISVNGEMSILNDSRRLNVALTRAKHKILFIGTMETLKTYKPYEKLFNHLTKRQIIRLEEGKMNFNWELIFDELK